MKIKKIVKGIFIAIGVVGLIFGLGIVGEQDYQYSVAEHQPYQPKGGFVR